ncbi:MAG: tRNA 2-selenouridine(34) synthase MnmH [Bacteroidetes bacterium HGW-Bacteroidetes-9]|jgi:tRNA 2-selenouridine synthase|nr:MAG: tRNA 2-selenouridine(34) synthase MnmH [Bacteroidetes bacterium HGW-Bacteroidetes-9]
MIYPVSPQQLFELKSRFPVIDVRSPGEYAMGHIPGAVNLPLFNDQERAEVGTRYKRAGRDAAFLIGLDFVGVKMSGFVKKLQSICQGKPNEVVVHCWRGGMRSGSMAWLFSSAGYKVHLLEGGYKAYRAYIRAESGIGAPMIVLGGMTGSGKTGILNELKKMGQQVIDLEGLAHNKGSVFGYLGQIEQPTNEQFENNLYDEWVKLDHSKPVWLEDESRSVGAVGIPGPFFDRMKQQSMILIQVPHEIRVERLIVEYAGFDKKMLIDALTKIAQPIGGLAYKEAVVAIEEDRFAPAISLVLGYYDKTYLKALKKFSNRSVFEIETNTGDVCQNAKLVLPVADKIISQLTH